ncbi:MAG: hypothetical protein VX527_02945 [Planctomycetota bacterium]|nr:hypothetical protein [Planctomycetota bacterium]
MNHRMIAPLAMALASSSMLFAGQMEVAMQQLLDDAPALRAHTNQDGRIDRLYGTVLSHGDSPKDSADAFLKNHAEVWGTSSDNLAPIGRFPDGRHLQPIMPERAADGSIIGFRFTGVYYTQFAGSYPVWRTSLCLLVRNSDENELVMAASDLRAIGDYTPGQLAPQLASIERATTIARNLMGPETVVDNAPKTVVFAGVDNAAIDPRVAIVFEARIGTNLDGDAYRRMLYVVDPVDGTVLHEENRILNCMASRIAATTANNTAMGSVSGSIEANAGDGWSAEECDPEAQLPLPYAELSINGTTLFADVNGFFSTDGDVGSDVSLTSQVRGEFFFVNNDAGEDALLEITVSDGDEVVVVHNEDANEYTFAEVDTYIAANEMRDLILESNPEYPVIASEIDWPINVNLADTCNAFYDYSSINFFASGNGCNNTGFGTVTMHEYGHHMIACAGSGQNEYGEGQSDVMSVLATFDSVLARGFYAGNCVSGLRNADNSCQYLSSGCSTCGSAIHSCGQLISGCVWDTWQALEATSPLNARQLIRDFAINSTLLHTGSSINPAITIDYLVLDDDDADIGNGTPHYNEIAEGFGAHDMDAPQLDWLSMSLPDGTPSYVESSGGTEMRVMVEDGLSAYQSGTAKLYMGVDNIYDIIPLIDEGNGEFTAVFSESDCAQSVEFWLAARTTDNQLQVLPEGAPGNQYSTISAEDEPVVAFQDDGSTDPGWTVSGDASDGLWERGIPAGGNNRPTTDCDAILSWCWVTENTSGGGGDVDDGETILTSPRIDASGVGSVSYCYWYRNIGGGPNVEDDVFKVDISDDDGSTWTNIQTVGPVGPGTEGAWSTEQTFFVDVDGFEANDQFRIRFNASDLNSVSRVEAAIDNVTMISIDCEPDEPGCPGDINGDNTVDVNDVLLLLSAWGGDCDGCPSDVNGDGFLDVNDVLELLSNYGDC